MHRHVALLSKPPQGCDQVCAQPITTATPSLEEFEGWYNIAEERDDGLPVLRSIEPVPEFEHAEFFDLYLDTAKWFGQLASRPADAPFDPLDGPTFFVRSDADDRTLGVDADFRLLTVEMSRRIQNEFLGRYPLWRVVVVGEQPSCSIVIYPSAIRFGNRPAGVNPEIALSELVRQNLALRELRERPKRKYIAQLQRLLPGGVRAIGDAPFLVCGVLDNYEGDYDRLTVALLLRGSDGHTFVMEGPDRADNDLLWTCSAFGLDDRGAMISYISVPETAAFRLVPWLPPADYRGLLTILERETGARHTFELRDEDIIRTTADKAGEQ
ncbi:MAG: hypothetical protein AB7O59_11045 [Pirellulales bacterium]